MIFTASDNTDKFALRLPSKGMVAFCSGHKGVGKTWLAATVCHYLALRRKKVLFFDADCGLENISYQLNLSQTVSYKKILRGALTLNNAIQKFEDGGFDIISAPAGENLLVSAPLGRVQILGQDLQHLGNYYDCIFLDCANDNLKAVNIFFSLCRVAVIIVDPDSQSLIEAYRKIEQLKTINAALQIKIAVNHTNSYEEGLQVYKSLLKAAEEYIKLNLGFWGVIRQDPHIRETVVNKTLLLKRYPECRGAEDAAAIGRKILEEQLNDR